MKIENIRERYFRHISQCVRQQRVTSKVRSLAATNRFGGKFISMTTSDGVCGHEVRLWALFTHVSENITSLATSNNEHHTRYGRVV